MCGKNEFCVLCMVYVVCVYMVCVCVCLCICYVFSSTYLHRDIPLASMSTELSPIRVLLALLREPYFVPGHRALNLATHNQGLSSDSEVCILAPAQLLIGHVSAPQGFFPHFE